MHAFVIALKMKIYVFRSQILFKIHGGGNGDDDNDNDDDDDDDGDDDDDDDNDNDDDAFIKHWFQIICSLSYL